MDINEQKYLAELTRLLGFMAAWDREAMLERYKRQFGGRMSDEEVIETLGSPTQAAINIARNYVPSPRPETWGDDAPALPDAAEEDTPALPDETGPVFDGADALPPEVRGAGETRADMLARSEPEEKEKEPKPAGPKRRIRPAALTIYILASVVIGLPVMLLLIAVGTPLMALGGGMAAGAVYACLRLILRLSMVSDMLLMGGAALVLIGIGLLVFWLGLWISISLGRVWIGGVIIRLGDKLCRRRED